MKRLLILFLFIVLAACTGAVVEEIILEPPVVPPLVVEEPVVIEPPVEDDLEEEVLIEEEVIKEPAFELPEGATVIIKRTEVSESEMSRLFGDDVYVFDEYDIDLVKSASHIIIIYDEWLISHIPPISFGVAQLQPMDVSVRTSRDKRFTLVYPGVAEYNDDFLALLAVTDVTEVGDRFVPHRPIIDRLYPQMTQYGTIGVLTTIVPAGGSAPFLPRGTHQTYTSPSQFFAADLDTRVIIYPVQGDLGVPPSRFGKRIEPGDIEGFIDVDGVRTILIRERFRERLEWFFLNYEVLGITGKLNTQEVTNSFQYRGPLYRGPNLDMPQPVRFVPRSVPFSERLSLLSNHVAPLDLCRIQQPNRFVNSFGHPDINNNFGFPMEYIVPPVGDVNIAIVAIEFPDVPGEEDYLPIYLSQVEVMEEWARFVSNGLMTYNIQFPDRWIMAPREAKYYTRFGGPQMDLSRPDAIASQSQEDSVQQLVTAADPYVDWSVVDFVQFVFPVASSRYAVDFQSPVFHVSSPRAGNITLAAWGAAYSHFRPDNPDPRHRTLWDWVAHELLHYQGINGHFPNGSEYSIMTDQHAETKALLSWESFMMGHFDEQHIACIDPLSIEAPIHMQLESLDQTGGAPGIKSLMIPVGEFEIIVIEYRTEGPFSILSPEFRGFTAYYIDINGVRERCDWCDPVVMEHATYKRYLRNASEILVCDQGYMRGEATCGFPSIVQYPGFHLDLFGVRLEFFNDGILTLRRLY
jgi:hypothetical protein